MEIAENLALGVAIVLAVSQLISLISAVRTEGGIFPASILWWMLFSTAIGGVLVFHLSPLHLIWIAVLCLGLAILGIITPLGQGIAMGFLGLLAMTIGKGVDDENTSEFEAKSPNRKTTPSQSKGPSTGKKGFAK